MFPQRVPNSTSLFSHMLWQMLSSFCLQNLQNYSFKLKKTNEETWCTHDNNPSPPPFVESSRHDHNIYEDMKQKHGIHTATCVCTLHIHRDMGFTYMDFKIMGFSKVSHTWRHGFNIRGTWGHGFLHTWVWHGIRRAVKGTLVSKKWEHGFLPPSCRLTWVSPTWGYWFLLHTCMARWVSPTWGYLAFHPNTWMSTWGSTT